MVPECCCGLVIVIDVVTADTGNVPVFGEAIMFGACVSAVEVCHGANGGIGCIECVIEGAVDCGIDGQQMFCGQVIHKADSYGRS